MEEMKQRRRRRVGVNHPHCTMSLYVTVVRTRNRADGRPLEVDGAEESAAAKKGRGEIGQRNGNDFRLPVEFNQIVSVETCKRQ